MSTIIVGLDIGTTKIACFIGQRAENGKLKILGYGRTESIGVERGVVRNIRSTADSIRKAVDEASNQADVTVEEVYVGIAGQHIKSMQHTGSIMIPPDHPMINEEDVSRLVEEQSHIMLQPGEQIIHTIPQIFIVDGEELGSEISPVGVTGKNLSARFHMVICNRDNLSNIRSSVEMAGLRVKGVVLEPIASSYAVLNDLDREAGVALVDIGGGTTDIAIFAGGIIRHTSVIPLAGNSITEDIRKGCFIMKPQAESLKIKFGSCMPSLESENDHICIPGLRNQPPREISMKTLAEIIRARLKVILEQVGYEIERAGYERQLLGGIVLTGGGARMKHISELSELVCKNHSRIGTPDEHLDEPTDDLSHPMYATSIGLVLYGLEMEERHPSAEDDEPKKKKKENTGTEDFDIFDMDAMPTPPATPSPAAPTPTPDPHPVSQDEGNSKQGGLIGIINRTLGKIFLDDVEEDDR